MSANTLLPLNDVYFLASYFAIAISFSAFVLGRYVAIMPTNRESYVVCFIGVISVLHAASNVIGVFSGQIARAQLNVWDSGPLLKAQYPTLKLLGGYTWALTGLTADYMQAVLTMRKVLYVMVANLIFKFDTKKHWYVSWLTGLILAFPGLYQVFWVYLSLIIGVPGIVYDDPTAKILIGMRMVLIKGTDIAFFIEVVQYARKSGWELTKLLNTIPKTIEALFYYLISTGMVFHYLIETHPEIVRACRNLTNKGSEVATFLYLYYASIKEMQSQSIAVSPTKSSTKSSKKTDDVN
jgi:hypothetical protein